MQSNVRQEFYPWWFSFQSNNGLADKADNLEARWNPNLFVENALGDQQPNSALEVQRDADGSLVVEKKTFEGTFSETMELRSFPFDIQVC